nr:bZIP transcription factor 16-like isoform X1 [Ipomoea batatas]
MVNEGCSSLKSFVKYAGDVQSIIEIHPQLAGRNAGEETATPGKFVYRRLFSSRSGGRGPSLSMSRFSHHHRHAAITGTVVRRKRSSSPAECDMAQRAEALKEEINRIKSDYEQLLAQNASLIRHISFGRFRRLCSPVSSNSGRNHGLPPPWR